MTPLVERLRKVLALCDSPNEGEAAAASIKLQELLTKHNLEVHDLELRGSKLPPNIQKQQHDLGKAAFKWKLDLARGIADHFFCHAIVSDYTKQVHFVGRPENVQSLLMLYAWLIDRIREMSSSTRKEHLASTGEHVDPLRWQVNFGIGAASRLRQRLREKAAEASASTGTALVLHHQSEISDWLEAQGYGYRTDGRSTKRGEESRKIWEQKLKEEEELLRNDPAEYYRRFPDRDPQVIAHREAERRAKEERNARRRKGRRERPMTEEEYRKNQQGYTAEVSGREAANRINLEPFVRAGSTREELES
jgi:hypothetical protein